MSNLSENRPPRAASKAHVALALVLDVSGSMAMPTGTNNSIPIALLNNGINEMVKGMKNDSKLEEIVDLAIFTFGEPNKQNPYLDFRAIMEVDDVQLVANDGSTHITSVLEAAVEATRQRCAKYSTGCYKPWIIVITDGQFHDDDADLDRVGQLMKDRVKAGKQVFFGFGVGSYDRRQLEKFCEPSQAKDRVVDLNVEKFPDLFSWIGKSMKTVSGCNHDSSVEIESPRNIMI